MSKSTVNVKLVKDHYERKVLVKSFVYQKPGVEKCLESPSNNSIWKNFRVVFAEYLLLCRENGTGCFVSAACVMKTCVRAVGATGYVAGENYKVAEE